MCFITCRACMKAGKTMSVCQLLILASDFLVLPIVHKFYHLSRWKKGGKSECSLGTWDMNYNISLILTFLFEIEFPFHSLYSFSCPGTWHSCCLSHGGAGVVSVNTVPSLPLMFLSSIVCWSQKTQWFDRPKDTKFHPK